MPSHPLAERGFGVLLHLTSLPGPYGCGDLGSSARDFARWLARSGASCWQFLPLTPTETFLGDSPYSSPSAFAGNTLLVSPELLMRAGLARLADAQQSLPPARGRADFAAVRRHRDAMLAAAFARAREGLHRDAAYREFRETRDSAWLTDYALFRALKHRHGGKPWTEWPEPLRRRDPQALAAAARDLAGEMEEVRFAQHLFFSQWAQLREHCRELGIVLVGDLPIYVTHDSADVWAHQGLFKLDETGRSTLVAGVPPDYFSKTGQRWGNPVYDWKANAEQGYAWWLSRLAHNLELCDVVRLDHFRGFAAYWEIPAAEKTAINGTWEEGPGEHFFRAVAARFPDLPFIAEDLGDITPDVTALRRAFGLPGMHVLMFGLGGDVGESTNALHHHEAVGVAYSGTHDNNTALGWFRSETGGDDAARFQDYLGHPLTEVNAAAEMVRLALLSPARTAILPMQDLLGLGADARMNVPASENGNWAWRMARGAATPALADALRRKASLFGRVRE
ncbi:MAG: 4-alpha-glucanotransferase [Thermodesulfobacteriota bacterium]